MTSNKAFVRVQNGKFVKADATYHFIGTNFWAGMNLATEHPKRLIRELDRLQTLGIDNLRIMGLTEGPDHEPLRIAPAVQPAPNEFREAYWKGLDFLLAEMAKRNMYAVICLSNFWPWSGGMAQYISWVSPAVPLPYPPPMKGGEWWKYQLYTAAFYSNKQAVTWYHQAIQQLIQRTNTITQQPYTNDPTIMAWQLANEPRASLHRKSYLKWIESSAKLIKTLAPHQLVSLGSEGDTTHPKINGVNVLEDHQSAYIDYVTIHCWIQNWGWYDPEKPSTYQKAKEKCLGYLENQLLKVKKLGKPLVLEEFGIARDQGSYDFQASTEMRDRFFHDVFEHIIQLIQEGHQLSGANFWAWGGEGRPSRPKALWQQGDELTGDPPHEHQGWYSVYDIDATTGAVIKGFNEKIKALNLPIRS